MELSASVNAANNCAQDNLLLEQILSQGTLPVGELRVCKMANCAGAAVLRERESLEGLPLPIYANTDGTPREDYCPVNAERVAEATRGEQYLMEALRKRQNPES